MLQQLKTDRIAQAMLGCVVILACFIFGMFGFMGLRLFGTVAAPVPLQANSPANLATPTPLPVPTATPAPTPTRAGIEIDRQALVNHFDTKGYRWREATFKDGTHQLVGEAQQGTGKIVLWSSGNDPEDLIELAYSFAIPYEGGATKGEDTQEVFNLLELIFPRWSGGEEWVMDTIQIKEGETRVNGVMVYFEWEDEEATEQIISILSIVE